MVGWCGFRRMVVETAIEKDYGCCNITSFLQSIAEKKHSGKTCRAANVGIHSLDTTLIHSTWLH